MGEKSGWVAVIIAMITTIGVIASKWLETEPRAKAEVVTTQPPSPAPTPAPTSTPPVTATPTVTATVAPVVAPQPTPAPTPTPAPADPAPAKAASMAGSWMETSSGAVYRFEDNGSGGLAMRGEFGPMIVMAKGSYDGTQIGWGYQANNGDNGRCQGTIPAPGHIQATCQNFTGQTFAVIFRKDG